MRYKTALLFVWLRLMGCVCEGSSANYEVTEYESKEPEGDTLEIYFSDVEELKDYLNNNPKVQEYFSKQFANNDGEFCKTSRATTIATTLTTSPESSTPSSPDDDIKKCLNENSCHEDANCTNFPSGYNCSCKAGFTGNGTLCTDINECLYGNSCHVYANCTNFPSGYNCSCKDGFTGNGTLCTDINECTDGNACHEYAKCTNFPSSYNCSCKAGFKGNGTLCTDIDECTDGNNKCGEGGNCTNIQGSYECSCHLGFTGNGKKCSDIDECSDGNACHEDANCTNFPSSYNCSCKAGFTGNGSHCTDIDECSGKHACHEDGECTNFPSSYNCSCKAGFTGNGTLCTDIDECLYENSCNMDANCTNFPSSYNCSCKTGFVGNGRPCKVPTSETISETSRTTTAQDETSAGCMVLNKTGVTCNIIYEGKCFLLWKSDGQNVDLDKASEYCASRGFQLGNIYDDCLYSQIKNQIGEVAATFWTGMTFAFGHGEPHQVYLHSNKTANFLHKWWYEEYPIVDGGKNLAIANKRKFLPPYSSYLFGIKNSPEGKNPADGALCEKNVEK